MAAPTTLQDLLRANAVRVQTAATYKIDSQAKADALAATIFAAGIIFIMKFDTVNGFKITDGETAFSELAVNSPIALNDWVVCDFNDSNAPKTVADLTLVNTKAIMSTSSAAATGIPSGVSKLGLYASAMIAGQGGSFGVDIAGKRAFIRGTASGAFTAWQELQTRHTLNDAITVAQTSADLNTLYPAAEYPSGFSVICRNIVGGGKQYRRVSTTAWVSSPAETV